LSGQTLCIIQAQLDPALHHEHYVLFVTTRTFQFRNDHLILRTLPQYDPNMFISVKEIGQNSPSPINLMTDKAS
jgi:hypothetical protein